MTDVFLHNGEMSRGNDLKFMEMVSSCKKSDSAMLMLVTFGGNPDVAYKIGRYMQSRYDSFGVLLSGLCKSAGTLLAISANELIFAPYGELGPLDVQMVKEDKMATMESGLNISEAFKAIEDRAKDTYHNLVGEILAASGGAISIHTALHAASEMVSALYSPIFGRIDPEEVGSRSRAMRIGEDYTERLNSKWENLKQSSINILSRAYSSHGFVIDFQEANALFKNVRMANDQEMKMISSLETAARHPSQNRELDIRHISNDARREGENHDTGQTKNSKPGAHTRRGNKENGGDSATSG